MRMILVCAVLGGLSACGDTVGEQALVGAGVGAASAALVGGDVVTGAVGGAGANVAYCQTQNNCKSAGLGI